MSEKKSLLTRFALKEFPQPEIVQLKYPVFLCHGYGAISSLVKPSPLHDPCMLMREHGVMAFAPNIVPYACIETRAKNWARLIRQVCNQHHFEKINIVAHSMGGLDIRHAIAHMDIEDNVASFTTLATPHRGTYLADLILKTPETLTEKISEVVDWFGNNVYPQEKSDAIGSVEQLTLNYVRTTFNPATPPPEHIPIFSYSAAVGKGTESSLNPIFKFQNTQIYEHEGINDSFVSVESATWGEHLGTVSLSHLNQINVQVNKENRPVYYNFWAGVVKKLAEMGF
ncbi:MAG: alpha/beta hydrolase [Balneolaceae bacterium]|nr:alpha/beta hydrolase [Balneolaceae bacterium]